MQTSDIKTFSGLMAGAGELYDKKISATLTKIYWLTLKVYDIEDVQQAFNAHIHNPDCGQFFPKPADIVRFIEGNGETRALKAWAIVEKALQCVGVYKSVVFDDCLIHAVIEDMGGWVKLCTMTNDDLPFRAREFQKRYMGFVIKKPSRYPKCLYGLSNSENAKNGYAVEPPLLVGDVSIAEQVLLNGGGIPLIVQPLQTIQDLLQLTVKQLEEANHESD